MIKQSVVTKLDMCGFTRGERRIPVSSYYSWPLGISNEEVFRRIKEFKIAFTDTKVKFESN